MTLAKHSNSPQQLTLRPARPADAELLKQWRSEPSVRQHQPLGSATQAQLRSELERQNTNDLYRGQSDKFQWIIESAGNPAGWITLVVNNWDHGLAEIGYALSTPFQHKGIMRHALELLLNDLFEHTRLARVEARCAVDNLPSQQVLEKVGFCREGRLRGYFVLRGRRVDNFLYAILRSDFLTFKG